MSKDKIAQEQQLNGVIRRYQDEVFTLKKDEGANGSVRGYAARFGSIYDMGWYTEEIHREAFKNANTADVRILQDHLSQLILGRTAAGTGRVWVDDIGLGFEAFFPDSPNGVNARVAVERGDITQSSWGFRIRQDSTGRRTGDKWEIRNGREHRTITDVSEVLDASIVSFPANPEATATTDSEARSSLIAYRSSHQEEEKQQPEIIEGLADVYEKISRALKLKALHNTNN